MEQVTVQACSNIALCKYWGKQAVGNGPATPSISLALQQLTATTVIRRKSGQTDSFRIDGRRPTALESSRVVSYLDHWRSSGLVSGRFNIKTRNSFPVAAGLASSASGFAALAAGLAEYSTASISPAQLSRLARVGSGSAARSISGGLSRLPAGADPAVQLIAPAADIPWAMAVAIVQSGRKKTPSRSGMQNSRSSSPYYSQWLIQAAIDYRRMLRAVRNWDLPATGELMESNTLAMHGCMLASRPALVYWSAGTLEVLNSVIAWRSNGLDCWATTDAGPNVAVLCDRNQLSQVGRKLAGLKAVQSVYRCTPGPGAAILEAQ